mmetsp:Transcript_45914/g.108862  ORF Transcript_45914/g.108862 Transcript_45914/m.108862 type:complete len:137 (+) Transcript_45914:137-547(+)
MGTWTKPQNGKIRPTAILDPSGRIVLTKERNWEQFQHEIPEGGDPMLTLITEPNKVETMTLKTQLWFTSVEYEEIELATNLGWSRALKENRAQGGTMCAPLLIQDRKIWWGIKDFGPLVELFKQVQMEAASKKAAK